MFLNNSKCIPNPGFTGPFKFSFDSGLLATPSPFVSVVPSGTVVLTSGTTICWASYCVASSTNSFSRLNYSPFNSYTLTIGFLTLTQNAGQMDDNIIKFFSSIAYAQAASTLSSGGFGSLILTRGYGAAKVSTTISGTPANCFPFRELYSTFAPLMGAWGGGNPNPWEHYTFVLNTTTLTMYLNAVPIGSISGIVWGAEFPSISLFGGNQFYDNLIILPVALTDEQVFTFMKDSMDNREMGVYTCMANSYCMNGTITKCPGNLISPVASTVLSDCYCRQPDMMYYNDSYCVCNTFRKFNNVTFGVCQNCPGSPTYVTCPIGRTSTYLVSEECSDYFCTLCLPGFYNNITNVTACTGCPAGKYVTASGATVCVNCAVGTFTSLAGLTVCNLCVAGTFMNTTASSACYNCSAGSYTASTQLSVCTFCAAGKYSTYQMGIACVNCLAGTFSSIIGSNINPCNNCSTGMYANSVGFSVCVFCATGTFASGIGTVTCPACVSGSYTSITGRTFCQNCTPGSYANAAGRSICTVCSSTTFASGFGTVTCPSCSVGTFTTTTAQSVCQNCPAGSYSLGVTTNCVVCPVGTFTTALGTPICPGCEAGTFNTITNATYCIACSSGMYTAFPGLTVCSNCSVGYYNPQSRASVCAQCSADSFSGKGVTTCSQCSLGSTMVTSAVNSTFFVSDKAYYVIRQVSPVNGYVTTVAGSGVMGTLDGNGRKATFRALGAIAPSWPLP